LINVPGTTATIRGIAHGFQKDGYFLYDPTGYVYVKNPGASSVSGLRIQNATSTTPQEGDYVQAQGQVSLDNGYVELDLLTNEDANIIIGESPAYSLPEPQTFTAIQLAELLQSTYIEWAQGGDDDRPSSTRTPFPLIPFEITCSELRVYEKTETGLCDAMGPGLDFMDFCATFQDDGYNLENAPYELSFYVLGFGTTTSTFALTGAKKLSPEFTYTTIADLKKNPIRAEHYNIQARIMADAYGTYVADDGTGRILVADRHLGGTYETAYQAVGTILSINGTLSQAFFEPRYELLVYDLSTAITHAPTVSLNTVRNGFPTTEYATATDETTPYWVSERFSCTVAYDSGGTASDPTLRCTYNEYFCTIANYKALNKESYPSEFTFTGYLVYGFKNCASLIFDSHTEA